MKQLKSKIRNYCLSKQQIRAQRELPSAARQPILPTRFGLVMMMLWVVMFIWSANHQLNLGYAVIFLLATMVLLSAAMTVAQLAHLQIQAHDAPAVFAGETAYFPITITEQRGKARAMLGIVLEEKETRIPSLPAYGAVQVKLAQSTDVRGYQALSDLEVVTRYPFEMFFSWQWLRMQAFVLVYPAPCGNRPLPVGMDNAQGEALGLGEGEEEFVGVGAYQLGEPLSRVAWKVGARMVDEQWYVKRFAGAQSQQIWLEFAAVEGELEQRLGQLCQWVLMAEKAGLRYGLRLPTEVIAPDEGVVHRHRCLRALALFAK